MYVVVIYAQPCYSTPPRGQHYVSAMYVVAIYVYMYIGQQLPILPYIIL